MTDQPPRDPSVPSGYVRVGGLLIGAKARPVRDGLIVFVATVALILAAALAVVAFRAIFGP